MSMQQILDRVRSFDGLLELAPEAEPWPELAWGDRFYYYAPDGVAPTTRQPYATIVTKDYPDDTASRLGDGRWRLNIQVGRRRVAELTGDGPHDPAEADAIVPHPLYGPLGWVSVVLPGERTLALALDLLAEAHAADRARVERRAEA